MDCLSLAALTALWALAPGGSAGDAGALMRELAVEFRALDEALAVREIGPAAGHAVSLGELAKSLTDFRASAHAEDAECFPRYARSLGDAAGRLESAARESRPGEFSAAVEQARATCVACHVRFRERNEERGPYPGHGGTISGTVSVKTLAGALREDRSNVLVFVEGVPYERPADLPLPPQRISQRQRRFDPRVLPILRGSSVEFPNDDFVYHNVFSLSETQPFDLGAYGPKQTKAVLFPRTGVARVYCNIHPEMVASIVVLENPCFALTDADGFFVITGVPEGRFRLRAWHELGGEWEESVMSAPGSWSTFLPEIREAKIVLDHKNKFGRPYRGEYR